MADIPRSTVVLQGLLPDNTTGQISPQDIRDFLVSALGGHGAIYAASAAGAQGTTTTPAKLTFADTDETAPKQTTPDHTDDSITIDVAGKWEVSACVSFSGSSSATFVVEARLDAIATGHKFIRKLGTGGDVGSASLCGQITVTAGQKVTLYVNNLAGSKSITVEAGSLCAKRLE
jgi:hypothetical protein